MENQTKAPPNTAPSNTLTPEQLSVVAKATMKMVELGVEASFLPPVSVGPIVSIFRFVPKGSTRVSQITNLADDIAVTLGVEDVVILRLAGESAVAIFVPNKDRTFVQFRDTVANVWSKKDSMNVPLNFGVDSLGVPVVEDLSTLPHLLIAGSTGSGKSTLVSSIIASIMYSCHSDKIRFILSDTKNVEFGHFVGAPHLLFPPATSVYQTMEHMEWTINEMEQRLKKIGTANCRNIFEYNAKYPNGRIGFIILVIDELADILGDSTKEKGAPRLGKIAEGLLSKIVQKSRAAGVYVIAATQRPSVNIVAGSVKANFPARISFRLPSGPDSRTVLGEEGAEHLLSQGDMLYSSPNRPGLTRLHAPYASMSDIEAAVDAAIQRGL